MSTSLRPARPAREVPPRACPHPVPGGRAACPRQAVPERPCGRAWRAPAPAAGWAEAVGWGWWQAQALSSPGHLGGRRPPPTSPATSSFPSASLLEASATLNRARHRHGGPPSPPDCSLPARQKGGKQDTHGQERLVRCACTLTNGNQKHGANNGVLCRCDDPDTCSPLCFPLVPSSGGARRTGLGPFPASG